LSSHNIFETTRRLTFTNSIGSCHLELINRSCLQTLSLRYCVRKNVWISSVRGEGYIWSVSCVPIDSVEQNICATIVLGLPNNLNLCRGLQ